MNDNTPTRGWHALMQQWGKDLQLWLYIVLTLQIFRLVLITVFSDQIGTHSGADSVFSVVAKGLRYDISTAAVWVAITFLASVAVGFSGLSRLVTRLRYVSANIYVVVAMLIFGIDLVYFDEYGDQFDTHLFGIVHDDTIAVLITIWKEYHPLWFIGLVALLIGANLKFIKWWLNYNPAILQHPFDQSRILKRTLTTTISILLFLAAVRGGTLWGEPIRLKHAFVVDDLFLNRTVLNPFSALRYTLKTKLAMIKSDGLATLWPEKDIHTAVATVLERRGITATSSNDLDTLLMVEATGTEKKPHHIFVIMMESQSGWPVMPQYRHIGLSPELSRLADGGIYYPNFLPSDSGTVASMNALLTGFPLTGLNINYEPGSLKAYPSSMGAIFKRLGYKTRFYYGGFLSWQRLDSFAQNQGFDEVYGGGSMSSGIDTNEWGVDDRYLFDFVLNKVNDDQPSLNFILTTSNHPPYDLDLEALGYPVNALPAPIKPTKAETIKVLGHLWYTDQQVGRFVDRAEKLLTRPLFAITGDHTARLHIQFPGDNVVEQTAVPLILYGPDVMVQSGVVKETAGSHIDLPPTLVEMAAPAGFGYVAIGDDLAKKKRPSTALSYNSIMGEDYIATYSEEPHFFALPGGERPEIKPDLSPIIRGYNALRALSWYRIREGSQLGKIQTEPKN